MGGGSHSVRWTHLLCAQPPPPCSNLLSSDLRQVEPPLTDISDTLFCSQMLRHWNLSQLLGTTSGVTCFHDTYSSTQPTCSNKELEAFMSRSGTRARQQSVGVKGVTLRHSFQYFTFSLSSSGVRINF